MKCIISIKIPIPLLINLLAEPLSGENNITFDKKYKYQIIIIIILILHHHTTPYVNLQYFTVLHYFTLSLNLLLATRVICHLSSDIIYISISISISCFASYRTKLSLKEPPLLLIILTSTWISITRNSFTMTITIAITIAIAKKITIINIFPYQTVIPTFWSPYILFLPFFFCEASS
jgi:hypothetical protein